MRVYRIMEGYNKFVQKEIIRRCLWDITLIILSAILTYNFSIIVPGREEKTLRSAMDYYSHGEYERAIQEYKKIESGISGAASTARCNIGYILGYDYMKNKNKECFIPYFISIMLVLTIVVWVLYISSDKYKTLTILLISVTGVQIFVAIILWLFTINEYSPRMAGVELLYPSSFFKCLAGNGDIKKLEAHVVVLQKYCQSDEGFKPIANAVKDLKRVYGLTISEFCMSDSKTSSESIKSDIVLLKNIIAEERDSFIVTNGSSAESFILNRQNKFTDILLTGIGVPILIEVIKSNIASMADIWYVLWGDLRILTCIFLAVLAYRIMKYYKNKLSIIRSSTRIVLYQKVGLLVDIFEHALDDYSNGIKNV